MVWDFVIIGVIASLLFSLFIYKMLKWPKAINIVIWGSIWSTIFAFFVLAYIS